MTGRKPDRSTDAYAARKRRAAEIGRRDDCAARTPYDLEVALPFELTSRLYAGPSRLSPMVLEMSWRYFLGDYVRQFGEIKDPIEYEVLSNFFHLKHRIHGVFDMMVAGGDAAFKIMGGFAARQQREFLVLAEKLQAMRKARSAPAVEKDDAVVDELGVEEEEDRTEAEFARERARTFDEDEAMTAKEAAQVMAGLPADVRARLIADEEERVKKELQALDRIGISSAADVEDWARGTMKLETPGPAGAPPNFQGDSSLAAERPSSKSAPDPIDQPDVPDSAGGARPPASATRVDFEEGEPADHSTGGRGAGDSSDVDTLVDFELDTSAPFQDDAASPQIAADSIVEASAREWEKKLEEQATRLQREMEEVRRRYHPEEAPTQRGTR